jgi:hypothetical protein
MCVANGRNNGHGKREQAREREARDSARLRIGRLVLVAVCLAADAAASVAQAPLRQAPVRIPGTDVVLEDGWTLVYTVGADYRCIYAVPASWVVSPQGWRAVDPRGAARVEVSALDYATWAALRSTVRTTVPSAALHEDTPRRLRIEVRDGARTWQRVAEGDGAHVCSADINDANVTEREEQVIRKIASTLHLSHASDMIWMKR